MTYQVVTKNSITGAITHRHPKLYRNVDDAFDFGDTLARLTAPWEVGEEIAVLDENGCKVIPADFIVPDSSQSR